MAPLSLGVATVTSKGPLTEAIWTGDSSVVLAPASNGDAHADAAASLLRDHPMRRQIGALGSRLYKERFSIEWTVDALADVARVR